MPFIQYPVDVRQDKSAEQARMRLEAIRVDLEREHGVSLRFSHVQHDDRSGVHVAYFERTAPQHVPQSRHIHSR